MHIRISRVKRHGKTYEYAQLVESYRRPDGMPAHRVIANLGDINSLAVENLRAALSASQHQQRVGIARRATAEKTPPQPVANLRYLDVAVLLELWREWGLDEMLHQVFGPNEAIVPPESVVAALCIQRCVDPGSKLYATEWLPRTALPLLLQLDESSFNNTRIHRVLADLDAVTPRLMAKLTERYQSREGAFGALFLDVTDTWFVGDGPALAARSKTKEGLVRKKIGIVLLCNEQGYPLRWDVIAGREAEVVAMSRMLGVVRGLKWTQQVPLVCDRAMGHTAQIQQMLASGLHFVTALTRPEYDSYSTRIPHQAVAALEPREEQREQAIVEAGRLIEAAGLQRIDDNLLVMDLGVVERVASADDVSDEIFARTAASTQREALARVMKLALSVEEKVASGQHPSYTSAGRTVGLNKQRVCQYRRLLKLPASVQQQILDGKAHGHSFAEIHHIVALKTPPEQCAAFAELLANPPNRRALARPVARIMPKDDASDETMAAQPVRVRTVLYFNPQIFVDARLRARNQLDEIENFVVRLNSQLASPRSRRNSLQIAAAVDRQLRKYDLVSAFNLRISEEQQSGERPRYQVELVLDQAQWAHRRRFDGFNLLVAHPGLKHGAADLCRLYRAKDTVEKNFQTIKSLVQLRPIRHHTDEKVRAHVTICMLALLLERTLGQKLAHLHSPPAAIELLATAHLNQYVDSSATTAHVVTRTNAVQNKILRSLRLQQLADYHEVAGDTSTSSRTSGGSNNAIP